ncbi:hypothetical protein [Micromonospora sp. WMMD708]|uniref:hypothetical protein n=1 Tax=Micromonospora sp. WMMD708 TaxID=3403464 RepID=UPI003BF54192
MLRRTAKKVWIGRAVALVAIAALASYFSLVGLDRADKLASAISVLVAITALGAPYLLPVGPPPSAPESSASSAPPGPVNISYSQGVQVNQAPGNVQHNSWPFISLVLNPKVMIFAVIALVAVVVAVLYVKPWAATADVRLVDYSVAPPAAVGGTSFEVGSMGDGPVKRTDRGPLEVSTTPIDITVKNNGSASAVIVEAAVEVVFAEHLEDCAQTGGPLQVEANYDVALPQDAPARPFTVRHGMRFEVEPHRSERFTLTVGPREQGIESWDARLYVANVSLKLDDTDHPLKVGRAAWVAQSGDGYDNLNAGLGRDERCLRENASVLAQFGRLDAKRSEEAAILVERWSHLTAQDGSVYKPTCQPEQPYQPERQVYGYCAIYTKNLLFVDVSITSSEEAPETDLLLRMISADGVVRHSVRCRVTDRVTARDVRLATGDAKGVGIEPCSDSDQNGVTLYAYPEQELGEGEMFISVEAVAAGTRTLPDADAAPTTLVKRSG